MTHTVCTFLLFCVLGGLAPSLIHAASEQDIPMNRSSAAVCVRSTVTTALSYLKQTDRRTRQQLFERLIHTFFDIKNMGDYIIGRHAENLGVDRRSSYEKTMTAYTAFLYLSKFDSYGKNLTLSNFTFGRAYPLRADKPQGLWVVKTTLLPEGYAAPVTLDWYLHPQNGTFRIIDVYIAGISFVQTKREEFKTLLREGGLEAFLQKIQMTVSQVYRDCGGGNS